MLAEPSLAKSFRFPFWSPVKKCSVSRAFRYMFYRVLSKGALPPGPPNRAAIERDAPFTEPTLISLKVPCKAAPSMYPQ